MKYAYFLILTLLVLVVTSCRNQTDRDILLDRFNNISDKKGTYFKMSNGNVTRYDFEGIKLDKHWFDNKGDLMWYSFYNTFIETEKPYCNIRFDESSRPISIEGAPYFFYLSTNLDNDTLLAQNVKAYAYIVNSPFLHTSLEINRMIDSNSRQTLTYVENPDFVSYFEDSISIGLQQRQYDFILNLNIDTVLYADTVRYKTHTATGEME